MAARAVRKGESGGSDRGVARKPIAAVAGPGGRSAASPESGRTTSHREATVHEAKTHLSRLLVEVEAGGSVVITRRGRPVARLEPIQTRLDRVPGSMKGLIAFDDSFFDPLPDDELELWGEI